MILPEVFLLLDIALTMFLTPFKRWRDMVAFFGVLPTVILAHASLNAHFQADYIFLPLALVLFSPSLIFTILTIGFSSHISPIARKIIMRLDPSLLPNTMAASMSGIHPPDGTGHSDQPPSITDQATSGELLDYVDFKSVPMAIAGTFFLHFGWFAAGSHHQPLVIMAHYFLMLASILINTRVVAFPAIVLTNLAKPNVGFNSIWPELSFV
jgi:hypothetical protein